MITGLGQGDNEISWSVTRNNCSSTDTVIITYNMPPDAAFVPDQDHGCDTLHIEFTNLSIDNSGSGLSWEWDFGDGTPSFEEHPTHDFHVSGNIDTMFTVSLIALDGKGCSDSVEHNIIVHPMPNISFTVNPTVLMYPESTVEINNLSGEGYAHYIWDFGDGVLNYLQHPGSHTYQTWGEYEISLLIKTVNKCNISMSHLVRVLPPPPEITDSSWMIEGCEPLRIEFEANTLYAWDSAGYYWDFDDGSSSFEENPTKIFDYAGEYLVNLTARGDGDTLGIVVRTDTVQVWPIPEAFFVVSSDTVMIPDQSIHCFNYSVDAVRYLWDFGDDSTSTEKEGLHRYTEPGNFDIMLTAWSDFGCVDTMFKESAVVANPPGNIVFPTAFTPNPLVSNGGLWSLPEINNDVFHGMYTGILTFNMKIFNRWGELIFESNDPKIGWDGYFQGYLCPQDVYIWKIEGLYKNNDKYVKAGNVTLLR
jgi:gliding motility-associated-like protein